MANQEEKMRYTQEEARTAANAVKVAPSEAFGGTVLGAIGVLGATRAYWESNPDAAKAFADAEGTTVEAMLKDLDRSITEERDAATKAGDDAVAIMHPGSTSVDPGRKIHFSV